MADTAPTDPSPSRVTSFGSIKSTSAALEQNLSRQNSYGLKVHRKVNKNLYDILEVNHKLVEILFEQTVSQTAIPQETVRSARTLLDQINRLRNGIKQRAKKTPRRKRISTLFRSGRIDDLYVDDIRSLNLLSEQLDVLIKTLNTTQEKREHTIVQVRENRTTSLTVRPRSCEVASSISHRSAFQSESPSAEEINAAQYVFGLLERPVHHYWGRHLQYSRTRLPNTCDWILENDTYQKWRAALTDHHLDRSKILWCSGSAGTGKSVLTSRVVDDLKASSQHVAYFYFGRGSVQNFADVLGSLLTQIRAAGDQQSSHEADSNNKLREMAIVDPSKQLVRKLMQNFTPRTIIVLDAVDKENTNELESPVFLRFLRFLEKSGIKIFLTSREPPGSTSLNQVLHLALPDQGQRSDLQSFAKSLILESPYAPAYDIFMSDKKLWNDVVQDYNVDMSFPGIRLLVSTLLRQTTRFQLEEMLHVEDSIKLYFNNHSKDVSSILQASVVWLLQSKRPMTISALQEALALLDPYVTDEFYDEMSRFMSHPQSENSPHYPHRNHYPTVKFLQHYGKDLFWVNDISRTVALFGDNLFQKIDLNKNITSLADMCIYYLSTDALDELDYRDQTSVAKCAEDHQFLRYACSAWQDHAQRLEISSNMRPKYVELLRSRRRLHTILAIEAWDRSQTVNNVGWQQLLREVEGRTAAHIAISCNDYKCLKDILAETPIRQAGPSMDMQRTDVNASQRLDLKDLIMYAFKFGRQECFDALYEQYLDFLLEIERTGHSSRQQIDLWQHSDQWNEIYDWFDWLHKITNFESDPIRLEGAVRTKDIIALRSAWSRAPSLEAKDDIGLYCLYTAIEFGHRDFACTLLDNGFDPSPIPSESRPTSWSPLHAAALKGYPNVVQKLLEHGADARVVDGKGNTVLFSAIEAADMQNCAQPTLDLIELLLTEGVNLESPCQDGPSRVTPLGFARNRALPKVVEILIMHGAKLSTDSFVGYERTMSYRLSVRHSESRSTNDYDDHVLSVVPDSEWVTPGDYIERSSSPAHDMSLNSDKQSESNSEAQQEIDEMLKRRQRMREALKRAAARTKSQSGTSSKHSKQSFDTPSLDRPAPGGNM